MRVFLSEPWMRWYDLPGLRRLSLARYGFSRKFWHRKRRPLGRLRLLYWVLIRGCDSEICARCGGPVAVVFHVPDNLWERYSGFENASRSPGGEAGGGVLCVPCFNSLYQDAANDFLRWTCATDDAAMVG